MPYLLLPVVLASVAGCAEGPLIDVRMIHSPAMIPSEALNDLTLRIMGEGGEVVHQGSVSGPDLAGVVELFDADELEVGRTYVVTLEAEAPSCRLKRGVGRSTSFVHRESDYAISLHVGCADEFAPPRTNPLKARMMPGMALTEEGHVVMLGGASARDIYDDFFQNEDFTDFIERYDPTTGQFTETGSLIVPRAYPSAVNLPDGQVALIGGFESAPNMCSQAMEVFSGEGTVTAGNLEHRRCGPAAAVLTEPQVVVVVGGAFEQYDERRADAEVHDATLHTPVDRHVEGGVYRYDPVIVPLSDGESALVIGGIVIETDPGPPVEIIGVGRGCDTTACLDPVEAHEVPELDWTEMAATYITCPGSGGAVYVTGGVTREREFETALDGVWCYRDEPGATGVLVEAGRLPGPRRSHGMVTVDGPGGAQRLLLIGGILTDADTPVEALMDGLLIAVDGCECSTIAPDDATVIPLPFHGELMTPAVARLNDGAVLVTGGYEVDISGDSRLVATHDAALFIPDSD